MRAYSTPESAVNGEITKLAIVECFVAIAIYIAIGYYRHTFFHYAWAVAVAPLMLFRTEQSSLWGLELMGRFVAWGRDKTWVLFVVLLAPVGLIVRLLATVYWLLRRPGYTLSEVPSNWIRQSLCTDFHHAPELLPLEAAKGDASKIPTFSDLVDTFRTQESTGWKIVALLVLLPILLVGYIPSLFYRISFKATALVYAPFVWVAHTSLHSALAIKTRLERFTKGEMEKVRRGFSIFVLGIAAVKLGIVLGLLDISLLLARIPSPKLVNSVVEPGRFPWWQGALIVDALLTYMLFFFADAALARLEEKAWPEKAVLGTVAGGTLVRNVLSILTMATLCYLAILEVAPTKMSSFLAKWR